MKHAFLLLNFILMLNSASGQEMWGFSNSNYAGNMGIFLNPSSMVGAPYRYDLNLIAADAFVQNTYVFVPANKGILFSALGADIGPERIIEDNYNDKSHKAFGHLLVIGPSYIRNKEQTAWGIHSAYRNAISIKNVPQHLAKFLYEKYEYPQGFGIRNSSSSIKSAWLGWIELGGSYGKVFMESEKRHLKAAATVNLLAGTNGAYLDIKQLDYTVRDTSDMIIHNMNASFAHSSGSTLDLPGAILGLRGFGLGTTLGLTYTHKRQSSGFECSGAADNIKKYHYRIGFSLMDLGIIHFFRQSSVLALNTETDRTWTGADSLDVESLTGLDTTLSNTINGNLRSESKNFSMFTPAAFSLQFDYSISPRWYANASWVNRIYFSKKQVARSNQVNLSIRYEKRRWEVNGNLSLFEYQKPSAGMAFRYSFFVLGTDRLLEWVNLSDVYGFDIFFGLKLNLCKLSLRKDDRDCPAYGI